MDWVYQMHLNNGRNAGFENKLGLKEFGIVILAGI